MKINKAKLIRNSRLEVSYFDQEGNEVVVKGVNEVHPDLKNAMKRLVPFFCELTEQKEADKLDWLNPESDDNKELTKMLDVTGVKISGGDDSFENVILSGRRTLSVTNKILTLNTPSINLDGEAEEYNRLSELQEAVDAVLEEAKLYIKDRKFAVVQLEMDFNKEDPFAEGEAGESDPLEE